MKHRRLPFLASVALVAAVAAPSARAFTPDPASAPLEFPLAAEAVPAVYAIRAAERMDLARAAGLAPSWQLQTSRRTGFVHAAWGGRMQLASAVVDEAQADALSRSFLLAYPELLGVREDNLQLRNVRHARGRYAVHYRQVVGGVPVRKADAWVLLDESGTVAAFGSDFRPDHGEIPGRAALSADAAVTAAADALGATPLPDRAIEAREVLVEAAAGELMGLTPAWEVVFETETPFGKWESIVHGVTGEILARRNFYLPVNVTGTADGDVQNQPPSLGYCDGSGIEPYANMTVSVLGGNSDVTAASGSFDISHGGTSLVDVTASFAGPYIDVDRASGLGSDASVTQVATPGTPVALSFTAGNARQDEMDVFFHGNRVRDFMLSLDPTFTQLDLPVVATVGNTTGFCPGNAWWNIGGGNMNFCEAGVSSGTSYANTGELANVVYHEYGHGVTEMVYSRNGQGQPVSDLHEGNSDVIANFLDRNPDIGIGFYQDVCGPGTGIRNADNNMQWPSNPGGHTGGQIIAGFHWDAWQTMLAVMPQAQADSIAFHTWHYARDLGTPVDQQDQVMWTFLVDDDDADLSNGTPNFDHFEQAALNHGFTPPVVTTGLFITHDPLPHTTDDVVGYDVVATIVSTIASLDPAALKVVYQVDGGPDQEVLFTATGNPDEYGATIPPQPQPSEITYHLEAADLAGTTRTDPVFLFQGPHSFDVAAVYDDLEGDTSGWSTVDNATTGEWEVADPIGTAAVPEDDATGGGGVNAWITGQCSGPNCSGGCTLGCNDIDGGTVELFSPVWDVSSYDQVTLRYDRFYNNNQGADPNNDTFLVEISNDGGASWSTLENTMASTLTWTTVEVDVDAMFGAPGQVRLHFVASDLNAGSIVECGVDDVRFLATSGSAVAAEPVLATVPSALALEQNRPNPFRPETTIRFALPRAGSARLAVYDVTGRMVRELLRGPREAGHHAVKWDGRDRTGERVAAGVYFYRLTAGGEVLTRKMTVLK